MFREQSSGWLWGPPFTLPLEPFIYRMLEPRDLILFCVFILLHAEFNGLIERLIKSADELMIILVS